ncbi:chondroitin AC/alginate lyase [Paramyrothecium foliicola]|nr:chondroitin AC/alginate lyase [Paramyrothecium foliicola]
MWYITKDSEHFKKSTSILDGWGMTLTNIIGTDRSLMIGLDGDLFVNAAEIMRWEGGWVEQGAKWQGGSGFSIQLYWLFARQSIIIGQANYGIASIKALLSFAVYLEDVAMYNYALWAYQNEPCAGIGATISSSTGQNSESGRDQAHVMVGLGWLALAARTVKNQGYDLLRSDKGLLVKGSEYAAKYNLNETVPYDPRFRRCEAVLVNGPWKEISEAKRGVVVGSTKSAAVWDVLHYSALSRGLKAPWTAKAKNLYDSAASALLATKALASPTPTLEERATQMCGNWGTVPTEGFTVYHNNWGAGGSGISGSQCTTFNSVKSKSFSWSTSWSWSGAPIQVKSYSNVALENMMDQQLMRARYSGTNMVSDVSYDLWLAPSVGAKNKYEIMIWLGSYGGAGPISETNEKPLATPTILNVKWKLFKGPNGDTTVYSFVAPSNIGNWSGDLKKFFDYLTSSQGVSKDMVVTSLQAGTEPFVGSNCVFSTSAYTISVK